MGPSSFRVTHLCGREQYGSSRSPKDVDFGTNRKCIGLYDLRLMVNATVTLALNYTDINYYHSLRNKTTEDLQPGAVCRFGDLSVQPFLLQPHSELIMISCYFSVIEQFKIVYRLQHLAYIKPALFHDKQPYLCSVSIL